MPCKTETHVSWDAALPSRGISSSLRVRRPLELSIVPDSVSDYFICYKHHLECVGLK